jgi:hypothetical protein
MKCVQRRRWWGRVVPVLNLRGNFQCQSNCDSKENRGVFAEASYGVDFWDKQRAALASTTVLNARILRISLGATIADDIR